MVSERTPLKNNDNSNDEEEYYYIEEEEWSSTAIYSMWAAGIVVCIGAVYFFSFYLPSLFIPEARPLDGIVKVKDLDVGLKFLSPERVKELGLDKFQVIDNDQKDENEESIEEGVEEEDDEQFEGEESSHIEHGVFDKKVSGAERYILIGDVHGEYHHLMRLLKKISFNRKTDHVLFLGDFITKGPDSMKVIDWAIENEADCILGNHEYYVLQDYAQFHNIYSPFFLEYNGTLGESFFHSSDKFVDDPEFLLAKKLQPNQVEYINKCSVIKRLGKVPFHKPKVNNGTRKSIEGAAVHAGLRWDLTDDLNYQNPMDNLEMRKLLPPFFNETTDDPHVDGAVSWAKVYREKQKEKALKDRLAVYYGHDARRGLRLSKYTKGLDSRCNAGGHLTAMVIWKEKELIKGKNRAVYKEQPFQVECS